MSWSQYANWQLPCQGQDISPCPRHNLNLLYQRKPLKCYVTQWVWRYVKFPETNVTKMLQRCMVQRYYHYHYEGGWVSNSRKKHYVILEWPHSYNVATIMSDLIRTSLHSYPLNIPPSSCHFFSHDITLSPLLFQSELFLLVTDQGYLTENKAVWETLGNVEGDGHFVDADFHTYTKPALPPIGQMVSSHSSVNSDQQIDQE